MWRVDLKVNRLAVDALVVSSDSRSLILDLPLDILEVGELALWDVVKLCPFSLRLNAGCCVWDMDFVAFWGVILWWDVDKLEDKWSSGDDAAASWEKVPSNDVLEDRRFTR